MKQMAQKSYSIEWSFVRDGEKGGICDVMWCDALLYDVWDERKEEWGSKEGRGRVGLNRIGLNTKQQGRAGQGRKEQGRVELCVCACVGWGCGAYLSRVKQQDAWERASNCPCRHYQT